MFTLNSEDVETLSLGAAILGSGGGGNPSILSGLVHFHIEKSGPVSILSIDELNDDHLIVPMAMMGAPLISLEKLPNSKELECILEQIKKDFPRKKIVLMPAEIGGCNALTPLLIASQQHLPVLDADLIGRAFPKLTMCKPAILNYFSNPTYVGDVSGEFVILNVHSMERLESLARDVAINFGSSASLATFLFQHKKDAEKYTIHQSISRAIELGKLLKAHQTDFATFAKKINATLLGTGAINNIKQDITGGFLMGYVNINTPEGPLKVHYQNEFLFVTRQQAMLAQSPDIIALFDAKNGSPISTESLQYGQKVRVLSIPAPEFWQQADARALVNADAFNIRVNDE